MQHGAVRGALDREHPAKQLIAGGGRASVGVRTLSHTDCSSSPAARDVVRLVAECHDRWRRRLQPDEPVKGTWLARRRPRLLAVGFNLRGDLHACGNACAGWRCYPMHRPCMVCSEVPSFQLRPAHQPWKHDGIVVAVRACAPHVVPTTVHSCKLLNHLVRITRLYNYV